LGIDLVNAFPSKTAEKAMLPAAGVDGLAGLQRVNGFPEVLHAEKAVPSPESRIIVVRPERECVEHEAVGLEKQVPGLSPLLDGQVFLAELSLGEGLPALFYQTPGTEENGREMLLLCQSSASLSHLIIRTGFGILPELESGFPAEE